MKLGFYSPMADRYLTPRNREWWSLLWWRWFAGPFFRTLVRLGMWELPEGGHYVTQGRAPWMHTHG